MSTEKICDFLRDTLVEPFLSVHYASWLNTKLLVGQVGSKSNGLIMSSWCDDGLNLREENWFGLYSQALYAWNSRVNQEFDDSVRSYYKLFFGLDIDTERYHRLFDYDKRFFGEREGMSPLRHGTGGGSTSIPISALLSGNPLTSPRIRS